MVNLRLKSHILEVVENQLKINDPKCTKKTFNRLMGLGFTEDESKEMIAALLLEEMYDIMTNQVSFNEENYARKLSMLPDYAEKYIDEEKIIQMPILNESKIGRNETCPCGSGKKYKKCCGK
jgi:uncharacterized protein YecA (UPF0149 family)